METKEIKKIYSFLLPLSVLLTVHKHKYTCLLTTLAILCPSFKVTPTSPLLFRPKTFSNLLRHNLLSPIPKHRDRLQ